MKGINKILIGLSLAALVAVSGVGVYKILADPEEISYKDVEVKTDGKYIKWKYKNEEAWKTLVSLETLTGDSKSKIKIRNRNNHIEWKYEEDEEWNNLIDLEALKGENGLDGKEIELSKDSEYIKYKYTGEKEYRNLIKISDLKGTDGKEIELTNDGTFIKYRHVGNASWNNIIDVNTLKGKDGVAWIDLGEVIVDNECDPENAEDCGYHWYIKHNLLDEGNYTFIDNQDHFEYHVKTERAYEDQSGEKVLIEYWSTEEILPYYISGWYNSNEEKWQFNDFYYITNTSFYYELETLREMINSKDWKNLGTINGNNSCNPDNQQDCGVVWYIKRNLLNTGKYIYTDNVDNFNWRVKTERSGNYVLITYWSTEEILPYYIRGWYNTSTKKWNFYEYYNASAQELAETNVEVTTMKQSLSKIAWNDLGVVNTTATCNPENAEECGAAWYIKQNLLNEGNYKFKDNVDYFEYHVKTERSENNVFITYWSTEEVWPYYIRGWYNPTTKIWGFDEYNQLTYESIRRYLDKTTALDTSVNSINTEINSLKSNYNKMDDDIYNANVIDIYLQMQQLECDNVDDFFKIYLKPENFKGVVLSRLFYNSQNTNEAYLYQYIGGDDSNFYYIEYTNLTSNVTKYNHGYLSEPTATSITWNEWQTK